MYIFVGSLWLPLAPFGSLLVACWIRLDAVCLPFGSLLAPFGSLWLPFGSLLAPFGSLWIPLAPFWLLVGSL